MRLCSIHGCTTPAEISGLCFAHTQIALRDGTPDREFHLVSEPRLVRNQTTGTEFTWVLAPSEDRRQDLTAAGWHYVYTDGSLERWSRAVRLHG
jgi:hypothetical protein